MPHDWVPSTRSAALTDVPNPKRTPRSPGGAVLIGGLGLDSMPLQRLPDVLNPANLQKPVLRSVS